MIEQTFDSKKVSDLWNEFLSLSMEERKIFSYLYVNHSDPVTVEKQKPIFTNSIIFKLK